MKSSFLRAGLALLCGVILSACGGSNGSLALSGTVTYVGGTANSTIVLSNKSNGDKLTLTISPGQNSFVFGKLLATDEQFDVVIDSAPPGATCLSTEAKGTASYYTVYRVAISCTANPYTLGGTVKGLTGTGLELANGTDRTAVLPPATAGANVSFTFPTKVANKALYGVTILNQPSNQTCTIDPALNPGTMPEADQLGLIVNCVNK
jgi:hypothetical protein